MSRLRPQPAPLLRTLSTLPFVALIWLYRLTLSPLLGGQCRFHPTCSQYALDAYRERGVMGGTVLTLRRLARCHPLAKGGYDPVGVGVEGDAARQRSSEAGLRNLADS